MFSRKRKLSQDGCKLFNVSLNTLRKKRNISRNKIKSCLFNLFTTKYDEQMEQILFKSYNNSLSLLDTLKSNSQNLSYLLDNMMLNIILLVLKNDKGEIGTLVKIKQNYHMYSDISYKAYEQKDYNTAILIHIALNHTALTRLNLKKRKKDIQMEKIFKSELGELLNCFLIHLQKIIKKEDFIPCSLVLSVFQKKIKQYNKSAKMNISVEDFENVVNHYITKYAFKSKLTPIYFKDVNEDPLLENVKGFDTNFKLINLSKMVK